MADPLLPPILANCRLRLKCGDGMSRRMAVFLDMAFCGAGLDRAAEIRGDARALEALAARPDSRTLLLWRGKVLVRGEGALALLPLDHPVLDGAPGRIFLGRAGGAGLWAADLAGWEPPDGLPGGLDGFADASEQRHPDLPSDHRFVELRAVMTGLSAPEAERAATAKAVLGWHRSHRFCAACGAESAPAMAGWQRDCPSCGTRHFPRTDPVVIMLITQGDDVLLGRSPFWPEGMFSLLAGFVEPGETPEAAVRREVLEETSVRVGPVDYLGSQPWPFPSSLMMGFRGLAESREIHLDPVELELALWVSRARLAAAFRGADPTIRPARPSPRHAAPRRRGAWPDARAAAHR